jgi:hypothetical protein
MRSIIEVCLLDDEHSCKGHWNAVVFASEEISVRRVRVDVALDVEEAKEVDNVQP